eukprot:2836921-Rhodomonas_salina.7
MRRKPASCYADRGVIYGDNLKVYRRSVDIEGASIAVSGGSADTYGKIAGANRDYKRGRVGGSGSDTG